MTVWDVHVTYRDESGERRTEFHGAFASNDLARALGGALARAEATSGGVQVRKKRPVQPPSPGPRAA